MSFQQPTARDERKICQICQRSFRCPMAQPDRVICAACQDTQPEPSSAA
jgi:hypothetical protein